MAARRSLMLHNSIGVNGRARARRITELLNLIWSILRGLAEHTPSNV